jgi:hypothetical protein
VGPPPAAAADRRVSRAPVRVVGSGARRSGWSAGSGRWGWWSRSRAREVPAQEVAAPVVAPSEPEVADEDAPADCHHVEGIEDPELHEVTGDECTFLPFEQNCAPSEGFGCDAESCKDGCGAPCTACRDACSTACDGCKAACTDPDDPSCAADCQSTREDCVGRCVDTRSRCVDECETSADRCERETREKVARLCPHCEQERACNPLAQECSFVDPDECLQWCAYTPRE